MDTQSKIADLLRILDALIGDATRQGWDAGMGGEDAAQMWINVGDFRAACALLAAARLTNE